MLIVLTGVILSQLIACHMVWGCTALDCSLVVLWSCLTGVMMCPSVFFTGPQLPQQQEKGDVQETDQGPPTCQAS